VEGIEKLMEQAKRPTISIFCVITEWNIGHLTEFLSFFKGYPIKEIGFMHTNYTPESIADMHNKVHGALYPATFSNTGEIDLEAMDLDLLWKEMQQILGEEYPFKVSFSPHLESRQSLEVFYHHPEIKIGKRCNDAFRNIMIKSDGSVIPAHGRCYNLNIGNLYNQSLKSIWNSDQIGQFRKTLNASGGLLPACSRCCSAF
jgi:Fe-coproporphyrin III synthase